MGLPSSTDTEGTAWVAKGYRQPIALSSADRDGHEDRGLVSVNSLAAIEKGAVRVHGTAIGIGELCGNVPIEVLLVNRRLMGYIEQDLVKLDEYCRFVSRMCRLPIAPSDMIMSRDAFRTATEVHATAIIKAEKKATPGSPIGYTGRSLSAWWGGIR